MNPYKKIAFEVHRLTDTGSEIVSSWSREGTPIKDVPHPATMRFLGMPLPMVVIGVGHVRAGCTRNWTIANVVYAHDELPTHAMLVRISDGKEWPIQGIDRPALGGVTSWRGRTVGIALPFGADIAEGQAVRIVHKDVTP